MLMPYDQQLSLNSIRPCCEDWKWVRRSNISKDRHVLSTWTEQVTVLSVVTEWAARQVLHRYNEKVPRPSMCSNGFSMSW